MQQGTPAGRKTFDPSQSSVLLALKVCFFSGFDANYGFFVRKFFEMLIKKK